MQTHTRKQSHTQANTCTRKQTHTKPRWVQKLPGWEEAAHQLVLVDIGFPGVYMSCSLSATTRICGHKNHKK